MGLERGARLGAYEIVGAIGAGGMGEVYRARDSRLGRDVAIKVLPASFASDPERLRRFEQEARAVAALNHPNILAVYDIGTHDGAPFLVTELLEGETLRERLSEGPLPARKASEIAIQAAHGVAAAHEKGIVHRDLKPANIFLTADGRVKILDFGLAKLTAGEGPAPGETQGATLTAHGATEPGLVLGTVGYMSPEQVRGKPADARSDIFALGAILYEMLSGRRAFQKDSSPETMAAILKEDPPELSGEDRKIPPAADRIVRHCLEKNPAERFQSARDLAFHLESLSGASAASVPALAATKSPGRGWLVLATVAIAAMAVGGLGGLLLRRGAAQVTQPAFQQLTFERGLIYAARFAPDGQSIYYSASWQGQPIQLYSTNPSSPESRSLELTNSALYAVSASELAISIGCKDLLIGDCEGTLATVPISGGAPREIENNVVSADWTSNGRQMGAIRDVAGQFQVEFPLGKVIYESGTWLNFLRISPDGNMVAFAEYSTPGTDAGRVVILSRQGKQIARSAEESPSVEGLAWVPGGKRVWFGATGKHAWANAIHSLSLSGKERIVLRLPGMLRLQDVSRKGQVLLSKEVWRTGLEFRGPGDVNDRDLSWLDAAVLSDLTPDGRELAFGEYGEAAVSSSGYSNLTYIRKTDGAPAVKLGLGYGPAFSPDGKRVLVFITQPTPHLAILPTGVGEAMNLENSGIRDFSGQGWMPDGKSIYFEGNDGHGWRMYVQDLHGGKPRAFTPPISIFAQDTESDMVSPDGKLAFGQDVNGNGELYPLAGGPPRAVPGFEPQDIWANWSSDGRSAYVYQDKKTYAEVFRLNLSTGTRQLVAKLAPADPAGLVAVEPVRITPDGKSYAYSYNRSLSDLFLANGVK